MKILVPLTLVRCHSE